MRPALLNAILILSAVLALPAPAAVYISGQVVATTGKPVAEAPVTLYRTGETLPTATTRCLGNGAFVLRAPGAGAYRLEVDGGPEFKAYSQTLEAPPGGAPGVVIRLQLLPTIKVRVLRPDGTPLPPGLAQVWMVASPEVDPNTIELESLHKPGVVKTTRTLPRYADSTGLASLQESSAGGILAVVPTREIAWDHCRFGVAVRVPGVGCGQVVMSNSVSSVPETAGTPHPLPSTPTGRGIVAPGTAVRAVAAPVPPRAIQPTPRRFAENRGRAPTPSLVEAGEPLVIRMKAGATLDGRVDDIDGKPVPFARVVVTGLCPDLSLRFLQGGAIETTNREGRFQASSLSPGRYQVEVLLPDGMVRCREVTLVEPRTEVVITPEDRLGPLAGFGAPIETIRHEAGRIGHPIDLPGSHLEASGANPGYPVTGRVIDTTTRVPMAGQPLMLYNRGASITYDVTRTAADGSYTLRAPSPETYKLSVYGGHFIFTTFDVEVTGRAPANYDLALSRSPVLHLRLTYPNGKPILAPKAYINVMFTWKGSGSGYGSSQTLKQGSVDLEAPSIGHPPEDLDGVEVTVGDPEGWFGQLHLTRLPAGPVTLQLQPAASLGGVIVGGPGAPVNGIGSSIVISSMAQGAGGVWARDFKLSLIAYPGVDGRFTVPAIPPGTYNLDFQGLRDGRREMQVTVKSPHTDITVPPGSPLTTK